MTDNPKTQYQIAVDRTQEFLSDGLKSWVERQKRIDVAELAYSADTFVDDTTGLARYTGKGVGHLITASESDPVAFDALKYIICEILSQGEAIPQPLASFAVGILRGKKKRPAKKARYAGANEWRDRMIGLAVHGCLDLGLSAVHDDSKNGLSACGAVAEALKRMGETPSSYRHVKAIWENFKRPIPPLDESTLAEIAAVLDLEGDHHNKSKEISRLIKRRRN